MIFEENIVNHINPTMDSPSLSSSESEKVVEKIRPITKEQGITREDIDPSEDSGISSISVNSSSIEKHAQEKFGEGIEFVNPDRIAEELRLKQEKIKRRNQQLAEERKLAREAYEKEIQEKQYKCLMHLLSKSKALTNFILKKFDTPDNESKNSEKDLKRKGRTKRDDSPPKKRGRKSANSDTSKKPQTKRARRNLNLSEEDITEELASMSDDEADKENFVQPKYFKGELRDYQKKGFNWLKVLYENGLNGILADEMGLGKTIQIIALLAYLYERRIGGPHLIVVPLSTLSNWVSEFERFAPELPLVVFYGNITERNKIKKEVSKKVRITENFSTYPIVLATYQMPLFDKSFFREFNWKYIIIDEAQVIKNFETRLFKVLKSYKSVNRLLLTGTPLQNNLSELWSLLNFLLPDIFNDLNVFQSWFDAKQVQNEEGKNKFLKQEQEKQILITLREILHPFMLRRLKEEVCPDVPPMKEVIIYAPLTAIQYDLYSAIIKRDLSQLQKKKQETLIVDVDGIRPKRKCTTKLSIDDLFKQIEKNGEFKVEGTISEWKEFTEVTDNTLQYLIRLRFGNDTMMFRHVVNHPYLIHFPLDDSGLGKVDEDLVKVSGKLLVLDAMLKKLKNNGHKVLFFSTMSMVLNIIEDYLWMRNYKYVRLDGSIRYEDRKESIDSFQTDPEVFLFLLTTKAGAVGLNLAAADTVIIYDSDWNPQNDLQAMARCHRIGQTRPVVVYRLCTKGTIDEEIIKRANAKRFLEKAVISKESGLTNTKEGLMKLKRLLEEDCIKIVNAKNDVYIDEELDTLMDRSDMIISKEIIQS